MPTNHELLDHRAIAGTILEEDIDTRLPGDPANIAWANIAQAHALLAIGTQLTDLRRVIDDGFESLAEAIVTPPEDVLEEVHPPDSQRVAQTLNRLADAVRYHLGAATTEHGDFVITTKAAADRLAVSLRLADEVRR